MFLQSNLAQIAFPELRALGLRNAVKMLNKFEAIDFTFFRVMEVVKYSLAKTLS